MNVNDLKLGAYFTTSNKDIWKLQWFCLEPMCELKNLETGEEEQFGMGGLTAQAFKRIIFKEAKDEE